MRFAFPFAVLLIPFAAAAAEMPMPAASPLSIEQVGKLLAEMGYEPKELTKEVWQISIVRNGWKVNIMVSLGPKGDRVWLESKFAEIAHPENVEAAAWLKLIQENERIGPSYFAFDKTDSRVHLYRSLNNVSLTPAIIKGEIEDFDGTVRKTQKLWRSEAFAANEKLTIVPRSAEPEKKVLSELEGNWHIVRVETRGESVTEDVLAQYRPAMVIHGENAVIKTGIEPERKVRVKLDGAQKPKTIDFIDEQNKVEAGIYYFEAGLLTICIASAGDERPRQFVTDPKNKLLLLVMRKSE